MATWNDASKTDATEIAIYLDLADKLRLDALRPVDRKTIAFRYFAFHALLITRLRF